jgi:tetratricopeptide (TPR) repeat protein
LWINQARALNNLRRWDEALQCAEAAVTLDAGAVEAWKALGVAVGNLGNHEQALHAFRRAADVGQPTAWLWTSQARALNKLNRWGEALRCAEAAVTLDASALGAWGHLGIAAYSLENYERALEAFRKLAEVGKPSTEMLVLQAHVLRRLGRSKDGLSVIDAGLALAPESAILWREKAWTAAELEHFEEALDCIERARQLGADARAYHHDRGDLLLLCGRFLDALSDLEEGLKVKPDGWDLQIDRLIALGCLGRQGPLMEALPAALAEVQIPPAAVLSTCDFMYDVALNCLRRGESRTGLGLFAVTLDMQSWHSAEGFRRQVGSFIRRVLDIKPELFQDFMRLFSQKVTNKDLLQLLDPFVKANDFLQTKNLTILERLFPEVRELVLDIVRRVDPGPREQLKRLT